MVATATQARLGKEEEEEEEARAALVRAEQVVQAQAEEAVVVEQAVVRSGSPGRVPRASASTARS